jgi:hypothetical protein
MPSATIPLQVGNSCPKSCGIDKTMPAIMNGRVSPSDWMSFCEQVEKELQSFCKMQRLVQILFGFVILGFIVILEFMIGIFFSTSYLDSDDDAAILFVFPFIPLGMATSAFLFATCKASKARTVLDNIEKICTKRSTISPLVSYHLRSNVVIVGGSHVNTNAGSTYSNAYYIEVWISDQPVECDNNYASNYTSTDDVATATAIPVMTTSEYYASSTSSCPPSNASYSPCVASLTTDTRTPEHRLIELGKIKHLLTPKEYENKRSEILSDV